MSTSYHREDTPASGGGEGGSFWTSYSDLLLGLSVIFLVLFFFAILRTGVDQQKAQQQLLQTSEYLKAKVPAAVTERNLEQQALVNQSLQEVRKRQASIDKSAREMSSLTTVLTQQSQLVEQILKDQKEKSAVLVVAAERQEKMEEALAKARALSAERERVHDRELKVLMTALDRTRKGAATVQELATEAKNELAAEQDAVTQLNIQVKELRKTKELLASAKATLDGEVQNLKQATEAKETELASVKESLGKLKTELTSRGQELGTLKEELAKLHGQVANQQGEIAAQQGQLSGKDKEIAILRTQLGQAQAGIAGKSSEISGLESELAGARGEVGRLKGSLNGKDNEIGTLRAQLTRCGEESVQAKTEVHNLRQARRNIASSLRAGLANQGIAANVNQATGTLTLTMDEAFRFKNGSAELTPEAKAKLKEIIPAYAAQVFSDPVRAERLASVTITGHASPRWNLKYVDPLNKKSMAYRKNIRLSKARAAEIRNYIFGEEIGDYAHKQDLKRIAVAQGKGYSDPVKLGRAPASTDEPCGQFDCAKSRRVELSFKLKGEGR
jgi:outer membrane protein OmpA-like peptidoglycan-associated protein